MCSAADVKKGWKRLMLHTHEIWDSILRSRDEFPLYVQTAVALSKNADRHLFALIRGMRSVFNCVYRSCEMKWPDNPKVKYIAVWYVCLESTACALCEGVACVAVVFSSSASWYQPS